MCNQYIRCCKHSQLCLRTKCSMATAQKATEVEFGLIPRFLTQFISGWRGFHLVSKFISAMLTRTQQATESGMESTSNHCGFNPHSNIYLLSYKVINCGKMVTYHNAPLGEDAPIEYQQYGNHCLWSFVIFLGIMMKKAVIIE